MEFIIEFFKGIDGWLYYIMLVVNTILIFAIIGYLGEKGQEQIRSAETYDKIPLSNGPVFSKDVNHSEKSIPKVAATIGNIPNPEVATQGNVSIPTVQNPTVTQNIGVNNNSNQDAVTQNVQVASGQMNVTNQTTQAMQATGGTLVNSNEQVPGVLVIESNSTTSPK